jgi:hypothetical protein
MFDFLRNLTKSAAEKRQEALHAYVDNALTPGQRQRFEQDLKQDAGLQAEVAYYRLLKAQVRQLPRHSAPRNFTLDPALYGRPQKQPLLHLYPALRVATTLTAFFFILALFIDLLAPGAPASPDSVAQSSGAAQVTAIIVEEAPDEEQAMAVEEGRPIEVTPAEAPAAEMAAEAVAEPTEAAELEAPAAADGMEATSVAPTPPAGEAEVATLNTASAITATNTMTAADSALLSAPTATRSDLPPLGVSATEALRAATPPAEASPASEPLLTQPIEVGTPWTPLRLLQAALGAIFIILALVTLLIRRRL